MICHLIYVNLLLDNATLCSNSVTIEDNEKRIFNGNIVESLVLLLEVWKHFAVKLHNSVRYNHSDAEKNRVQVVQLPVIWARSHVIANKQLAKFQI